MDNEVWNKLSIIIKQLADQFSIDHLFSIVPTLSNLDAGDKELVLCLYDRFVELEKERHIF
jgi:hypothetical protein